jgi:hypothetical protein
LYIVYFDRITRIKERLFDKFDLPTSQTLSQQPLVVLFLLLSAHNGTQLEIVQITPFKIRIIPKQIFIGQILASISPTNIPKHSQSV